MRRTLLEKLNNEIIDRFSTLIDAVEPRTLKSNREGLRKGHWNNPDSLVATKGSDMEIRMAVDDFKTILAEVRKLK